MQKMLIALAALLLTAAIYPAKTFGFEATAAASASLTQLSQPQAKVEVDRRAQILEEYLQTYNSPFADQAKYFVEIADTYNLDWKLVVAIAGVESYYGQQIPAYSYNGWGYGVYGNNVRRFSSWEDGIIVVSKALREDYIGKNGTENLYTIGSKYAADPGWPYKVQHFMNDIDAYYQENQNPSLPISL